jgi:hypothetical protein
MIQKENMKNINLIEKIVEYQKKMIIIQIEL